MALNVVELMVGAVGAVQVIELKTVHPLNTSELRLVRPEPSIIFVRPLHLPKHPVPMVLIVLGNVIDTNFPDSQKAEFGRAVRPEPNVTPVNNVLLNTFGPSSVTESGIVMSLISEYINA